MSSQPQQDPPSQPVGAPVYRPPLQQAQPQQPPQPRPQIIQGGGAPPPRPFIPGGPVGPPPRGVLPPRPSGPNSFAPQQQQPQQPQQLQQQQQPYNPRPQIQGQPPQPQGQPYPQGLPPGVRPPVPRPQGPPQPQGLPPQQNYQQPHPQYQQHPQLEKQGSFQQHQQPQQRPPAPPLGQVPRQGSFASTNQQPPPKPNMEGDAALKNRSFSIAGSGVPTPMSIQEEDRRRSVSNIGGKPEEPINRNPGLSLIREGVQSFDKKESPLNVGLTRLSDDSNKGSRESIRSDISDRPESRLTGSRMTDSIMGSLDGKSNGSPKIYKNDDDDVVIQNNGQLRQNTISPQQRQVNGYKPPDNVRTDSPNLVRTDSTGLVQQNKPPEPAPRPPSSASVKREATPDLKRVETPDLTQRVNVKPTDLGGPIKPQAEKMRKAMSAPKTRREGDNDSGVDESTQGNDINGSPLSPGKKSPSKIPGLKGSGQGGRSGSKSAVPHTPNTPESASKLPMNKIQVGAAPSPNIKAVKSKIGSLENATHKPGGGNIKIENRKLEFKGTPRIAAKNDAYQPGGGDKKIPQTKLQWNAKSKIGSLQNAAHKPGGGDKKIESVKLDFKEKAKPKVASTININHKPGGGDVKIEDKKLEIKAQSKIGSLDNVKHRPGGGDIKIFDDKQYLKQVSGGDHTPCESPVPPSSRNQISDENLNREH